MRSTVRNLDISEPGDVFVGTKRSQSHSGQTEAVEGRGGFGAPGACRADVSSAPQAGCGHVWRGSPKVNARKMGFVHSEGDRHGRAGPSFSPCGARRGHLGLSCCKRPSFPLWLMAASLSVMHYMGEGVAWKCTLPGLRRRTVSEPDGLPMGERAKGSGVGLGKDRRTNFQASQHPGPQQALRDSALSLTHPWNIPHENGLPAEWG